MMKSFLAEREATAKQAQIETCQRFQKNHRNI